MGKFYFHVRQGDVRFEDKQGADFPRLEDAWRWAAQDAKALADQQVLDGPLAGLWIEIGDESGAILASLPFSHVVAAN